MGKIDPAVLLALAAGALAVWVLGREGSAGDTPGESWIPVNEPLLQNWAETAGGMVLMP
jgi:hypothetical protein